MSRRSRPTAFGTIFTCTATLILILVPRVGAPGNIKSLTIPVNVFDAAEDPAGLPLAGICSRAAAQMAENVNIAMAFTTGRFANPQYGRTRLLIGIDQADSVWMSIS